MPNILVSRLKKEGDDMKQNSTVLTLKNAKVLIPGLAYRASLRGNGILLRLQDAEGQKVDLLFSNRSDKEDFVHNLLGV